MQHPKNTLYTGDNLDVLTGIDSNSVDVVYLDPPYNSNKSTFKAPIGSKAAGAAFKDRKMWNDVNKSRLAELAEYVGLVEYLQAVGNVHGKQLMAYLTYMAQRIAEMERVLKPTGSFYLHVDQTASHYLKGVCDAIFGSDKFRNEIIWSYRKLSWASQGKQLSKRHQCILFYGDANRYTFNQLFEAYSIGYVKTIDRGWLFSSRSKVHGGPELCVYDKDKASVKIAEAEAKGWKIIYMPTKGVPLGTCWDDISLVRGISKEFIGYPTQKPLELLRRIIKMSSNPGDVILDPFCGGGTTLVAAQQLGRKWIGIDVSKNAAPILMRRLGDDSGLFTDFAYLTDVPQRTDVVMVAASKPVRDELYVEQGQRCNGCHVYFPQRNLELDHIIPRSKGGGDYKENYQLLCGTCNRMKGDRPMAYLVARVEVLRKEQQQYVTFANVDGEE